MMADSFYIHLPSDSSLDVFPDNTISRFTTKLAKPVDLDGPYEVGLSEIIYPTDYYNVDNREENYYFGVKQIIFIDDDETTQESYFIKSPITSNLYYDRDEFLDGVNRQIDEAITKRRIPARIRLTLDSSGRVCINITRFGPPLTVVPHLGTTATMFFELSEQFCKRLGFDEAVSMMVDSEGTLRAKHRFDLHMGKNLMYVYSDVVSHCLVGNVSVPLLRACNLHPPSTNGTIHLSFPDVHYKPVQKSQFDTIDILINTEEGQKMPFISGKVLVTLHFRRLSSK